MVRSGAIVLLGLCACYSPPLADCRIRCALDDTCPHGMTCDGAKYCRTIGNNDVCTCNEGDRRVCGSNRGVCRTGIQTCTADKQFGPCEGGVQPSSEVCDSLDNDCDGTTDEDPVDAPQCALTVGVCSNSFRRCVDGRYAGQCLEEYGPNYERVETSCDQLDNDCDGLTDRKNVSVLAAASTGYELVGLDGGYALAVGAGGGTSWSVQLFDPSFAPLSPPVSLGASASVTHIRGIGNGGNLAWFVWQTGGAVPPVELQGASVDLAAPAAAPTPLTGLRQPGQLGAVSVGARGSTLVAVWPADGGFGFAEWPSRSGAPELRFVVPPQARFASAYEVGLSTQATTLTFAGRYFTDDAGTSDLGDGVLALGDGGSSTKYVATRAALLDTGSGVKAVYDGFCDYALLGFTCRRSYVVTDFDVHDRITPATEVRVNLPGFLSGSSAMAYGNDFLAAWVEGSDLYIGVPTPGLRVLNGGKVPLPGVAYGPTRSATAGGQFVGIVYVANGVGQLNGALVCPF
ncbi:MAG: hypothetical protein JNK82_37220 [Myxococcaceae bacterium]|nr:hypothetical protein [Myxococcaceae bacterium]